MPSNPDAAATIPAGLVKKAEEINLVLSEPTVDLWRLRALALSEGGLVHDTLRRRAWPKLVGLHEQLFDDGKEDSPEASPKPRTKKGPPLRLPGADQKKKRNDDDEDTLASVNSVQSSRDRILTQSVDFEQIERDVARCTWHLLTGTQRMQRLQMEHKRHKKVARLIRRKQRRLANLINLSLVQSYSVVPEWQRLRYYQGYHDVACIFLSTLGGSTPVSFAGGSHASSLQAMAHNMGLDFPAAVLLQVSQSHFADCLRADFLHLQTALKLSLFPLICFLDPDMHAFLDACEMAPFFALSWVITWFAHDIRDTEAVKRLFDLFLVSHPLMPIYLSVAMVLHPYNRKEVLETECDFSMVHQTLTGLPRNSSMAGWKYRPGDGYVSDEEEEDPEEGTVSTDPGSLETDFLLTWQQTSSSSADPQGQQPSETVENASVISSNLSSMMESQTRVPFQELIDRAIGYMRRVPPRKLLTLATRFYGEAQVQTMLDATPDITLFEGPPLWVVAPSAKADWVLKQRARERRGVSATNRRDRRKRLRSESMGDDEHEHDHANAEPYDKEAIELYLKKNRTSTAVIATGFGPGDDAERRKRRRKRLALLASVAVVVVAVAIGYAQRQASAAPVHVTDRLETPVETVMVEPLVEKEEMTEPLPAAEEIVEEELPEEPVVVAVADKEPEVPVVVNENSEGSSEQWVVKWMDFLQETDPDMVGVPFLKNAKQAFQGLRHEALLRPATPSWGDFVSALKAGVAREAAEFGGLVEPGLRSLSRVSKRLEEQMEESSLESASDTTVCSTISSPLSEESANFLFSRKRDFLRSGMNPAFSAVGKAAEPMWFQEAAEPQLRPRSRASMHVQEAEKKKFWRNQLGKLEQDVVVWEDSPAWGQLMTAVEESLIRGTANVVVRLDSLRRAMGPRLHSAKVSLKALSDQIRDVLYRRLVEPGNHELSMGATDPTWGDLVSKVRVRVVQSAANVAHVTAVAVGPHLQTVKNVTMVIILEAKESAVGKTLQEAVSRASKAPLVVKLQQVHSEMEPVQHLWKQVKSTPAVVAVGGRLRIMADSPAIREVAKALQESSATDIYTEYYGNTRLQVVKEDDR